MDLKGRKLLAAVATKRIATYGRLFSSIILAVTSPSDFEREDDGNHWL